ncbi:hypothetical protein GWN42_15655 [candidate division KSB1 bacterium]|nr:hypothetical protein [candidate division KSB1 bacterium]
MKGWRKKLDDLMNAVTFAEANEHDTALSFVGEKSARKKKVALDDMMTAITFAEAGLADTAREFLQVTGGKPKAARLELPGVKIWVGSIPVEDSPLAGVKIWSGLVPVNA